MRLKSKRKLREKNTSSEILTTKTVVQNVRFQHKTSRERV